MAIPSAQLETWSHQGSVAQSRDTYATIRRSLEADTTGYAGKDYDIFLQGSYGNDTNIFAESDVDVVIRLTAVFSYDISSLSAEEQQAFHADSGGPPGYNRLTFREDVAKALSASFGSDVTVGNKAIAIAASGTRRKADVIPAVEFRRYRSYSAFRTDDYESGIEFVTSSFERIVNYPKQHSRNLTSRHQSANQWLKPCVRILKNMRRRMEDDGLIRKGLAPSYFLEGLLYNVPPNKFGGSYQNSMIEAINWLLATDRTKLVCANEQYYLLRDVPHVCWAPRDGEEFLAALVQFWRDW